MSERKTICDLGLVTVDFGWFEAVKREPGTFRLTFRHRNGTQTGRIDVDQVEAEQFALELATVTAAIVAQLRSSPQPTTHYRRRLISVYSAQDCA